MDLRSSSDSNARGGGRPVVKWHASTSLRHDDSSKREWNGGRGSLQGASCFVRCAKAASAWLISVLICKFQSMSVGCTVPSSALPCCAAKLRGAFLGTVVTARLS
eukprot:1141631-Pelagomonas_calceolata.AAC.4